MIYNLYKPRGISSNRFLRFFQKKYGFAKAGFVGTLDPLAEGVLPVFVGSATRLIPFLKPLYKTYFFRLHFFYRSRSLDAEGYLTHHPSAKFAEQDGRLELLRIIAEAKTFFLTQTEQTIPSFSAKKIAGQRLYQLARKGRALEESLRKKVEVVALDFLPTQDFKGKGSYLSGRITVSPGFFVRSLAQDFAALAEVDCYLESLVREDVAGIFNRADSLELSDLELIPSAQDLPLCKPKQILAERIFLKCTDFESLIRLRQGQKIQLNGRLDLSYRGQQITLDCHDFSTYIQSIDRDFPWQRAEVFMEDRAENLIAFGFLAEGDPTKPNQGPWIFAPKVVF